MTSSSIATVRNILRDPLPGKLFVDTNFFKSMIFANNPAKESACKYFLKRLRDETENNPKFLIGFNTVIYYEMYIALAHHQLKKHGMSKNIMISDPQKLKPYIATIKRQYDLFLEILKGLRKVEISLKDGKLMEKILETQTNYRLQYADAFHLGTMFFANEKDFASFDVADFKQIPGINLWCAY